MGTGFGSGEIVRGSKIGNEKRKSREGRRLYLIRRLGERDARAWRRLRLEALEREPRAFAESVAEHRATTLKTIIQRLRSGRARGSFVVGAFAGERLVGTAGFARHPRAKLRHKGVVWGVYVTPKWRGKGISRELLCELLHRVREQSGLEQVTLMVARGQTAAQRLYQSLGFRVYARERRALKIGNTDVDEDLMVLDLRRLRPGN